MNNIEWDDVVLTVVLFLSHLDSDWLAYVYLSCCSRSHLVQLAEVIVCPWMD